jgi:PhzF family phenazine biosynthesis protein
MAKRSVQVFQVDAFTNRLFEGNPANVVLGAEQLAEREMQELARELNHSDSAFVLPPAAADHDVWLRFFTPTREVGFVGHASVAAHVARLAAGVGRIGRLRQSSRSGTFEVEISGSVAEPQVAITFPAPVLRAPIGEGVRRELLDIFGLDSTALDARCPLQVLGRSSTRLFMGLRSAEQLNALVPDFVALTRVTPHVGADGFFLFVRDARGPGTSESRMFCPVIGIPEDPVSGNAHGMLGAYLVVHGLLPVRDGRARLLGSQGRSMHRPGEVRVEVAVENGAPTTVTMSGTARVVYATEISLD